MIIWGIGQFYRHGFNGPPLNVREEKNLMLDLIDITNELPKNYRPTTMSSAILMLIHTSFMSTFVLVGVDERWRKYDIR